jgi:hypothetical protein
MFPPDHFPGDLSRRIFREAVRARDFEIKTQVVREITTAFQTCVAHENIEYSTPIYEGSRDVLHVSLVYDGPRPGAHKYSLDLSVGEERFEFYLAVREEEDTEDALLHINTPLGVHRKYGAIVIDVATCIFEAKVYQLIRG